MFKFTLIGDVAIELVFIYFNEIAFLIRSNEWNITSVFKIKFLRNEKM